MTCKQGARCSFLAIAGLACSMLFSSVAAAQETPQGPAFRLRLDLDLSIVLIAGATTSSFFFLPEAPGVTCAPRCDRSKINALDRLAAGLYDPQWSTIGNIGTAATMAVPLVVILVDEGARNGLNDDLVVAEAALVASALQVSLSYAVARPRPRVYGNEASLESRSDANAARSFFSGHVANTMATSVAGLRTFQRLRKPLLGWTLFGIGAAGSAFVGVSRVVSGAHFPSDVLAGAAIGAGMGLALPAVHRSGTSFVPYGSAGGGGLLVSGVLQ
jgi:membrane-associated phospholipid phosphatase